MDFVTWEPRYNLGIAAMDAQHRKLVDFTNKLFDGCLQGAEAAGSAFRVILKDVVDYVKVHFRDEEALLQAHDYPEALAHKKEHEQFVHIVLEQVAAFESGKKFVPNTFVRFLRDWLLEHIAVSDHRYAEYLLARGVR